MGYLIQAANNGKLKIKQVTQERFALPFVLPGITTILKIVIVIALIRRTVRSGSGCTAKISRGTFDEFVEFTAIQPHTTTLGTIVNFNPLPVGNL
jgi:hypothetical protein